MPSSTKNRSPWCLGQLVTLVWWLGILATLVALLTRVIVLEDWTGPIAPICPVTTDAFISNLSPQGSFWQSVCRREAIDVYPELPSRTVYGGGETVARLGAEYVP